ncbi:hypothetical protein HNR39_000336 [Glaciimonas immobilis]|uniref:Uncharacterized protein n=1 Tax=Glaciimonas immobilis TaxID=728004 RepID=A0A840RNF6_9BURK|nr:hypothetical protein [Glaciimonas immobilis]
MHTVDQARSEPSVSWRVALLRLKKWDLNGNAVHPCIYNLEKNSGRSRYPQLVNLPHAHGVQLFASWPVHYSCHGATFKLSIAALDDRIGMSRNDAASRATQHTKSRPKNKIIKTIESVNLINFTYY